MKNQVKAQAIPSLIGFIVSFLFTGYYVRGLADLVHKRIGIIETLVLPILLCGITAFLIMKLLKKKTWLTVLTSFIGSSFLIIWFNIAINLPH